MAGPLVEHEDWMKRAACRGLDPVWFVPDSTPEEKVPPDPRAFAICWGKDTGHICPVREECEAYGRKWKCSGCWGGVALYLGRNRRSD